MIHFTRQEARVLYSFLAVLLLGVAIAGVRQWAAGQGSFFYQKRTLPVLIEKQRDLMVFVRGAVKDPGVYRLPLGSRILEAVQKANPTEGADIFRLDLAEFVRDGQTLDVPLKTDSIPPQTLVEGGARMSSPLESKIDLNTADISALDGLPGIGPGLAARIVEFRQKHPFVSVEDLFKVGGIGQKKFEQIKDRVKVE